MNENARRSATSPAGLGSSGVESTVIVDSAASGKTGADHYEASKAGSALVDGAAHYSGDALLAKTELRGVSARVPSSDGDRSPRSSALPIGPIRLLPDGRCGCRACLLDAKLDEVRRTEAWAAMVHELGLEALRAQALRSVAPFLAELEEAS